MPRTAVTGPYRQPVNNLVYNGDFEYAPVVNVATTTGDRWIDGTAGGSTTNNLFGWGGVITVSASVVFDTSVKYSGNASLKLSCLNASGQATAGPSRILSGPTFSNSSPIPVLPNTSYTLTARVKTDNVATNSAFIDIREYTGALATVATTSSTRLTGTNDWTLLTCTAITGATTRFIMPILRNNVAGNISDAWFDDIELRPTTATTRTQITGPFRQPVDNMVRNGDFEYAPAFTAATNAAGKWIDGTALGNVNTSPIYAWGTLTAGANAVAQFDSARKYTGSNSLKASITIAGANTISVATSKSTSLLDVKKTGIPVLPNTSYTLSGYMMTSAISGTATTGAQLIASERNADGTQAVANPTVGVPTTTDWTRYSVTFTTSATTKYIMVKCNIQSDGAATLIMDAWFDNIKLDLTSGTSRTVVT